MRIAVCLLYLLVTCLALPARAETTPAKQWEGKVVVMANGELIGRVEDLAVDFDRQTISYVVVSVGSFLIDENLIAVDPAALRLSDDGFYLVLHSDNVDTATRFGTEDWPQQADVLPASYVAGTATANDASGDASNSPDIAVSDSIATISDGQRRATIRPGEISATIEQDPDYQPPAAATVQPKRWSGEAPLLANGEFEQLDEDGDGYLTRAEIGNRMQSDQNFDEFDYDANDGIDVFEFQVMIQRQ